MESKFDNATLKIWFQGISTSRNITNVVYIKHVNNLMEIKTNENKVHLINFNNVNLIEEV